MPEALLLLAAAVQMGLRLAGRPSLASRLLPLGNGPPFFTWAARLWIGFALPALGALLLLGRSDALLHSPAELDGAVRLARTWGSVEAWPILVGMALGSVLGALFAWWRRRCGKPPVQLGRPPRLPARPSELPAGAVLAASAGVTEELYFRLMLPLLVAAVTGSAVAGVLLSALLFGLMHRHQGRVGVVATGVAGLFLQFVHLASGQLWLAMACHVVIDLNGLVIRPAIGMARRSAA